MRTYDLEIFAHDYLVGIYDGQKYIQYWNEDIDKIKADYEELRQYNKEWVDYASSLENYIYATTGKIVGSN